MISVSSPTVHFDNDDNVSTNEYHRQHYLANHSLPDDDDYFNSFSYPNGFPTGNWNTSQFSPEAFDSAFKNFASPSSLMHPESAGVHSSQHPPSLGRSAHQREPSLSSLGSAGPASPYTYNTSNPRIAITDSTSEALPDMYSNDPSAQHSGAYYQVAKPMDAFSGYQNLDSVMPEMAYPMTVAGHNRRRTDRGFLPAPEVNSFVNRSHPASVASSIGGDSPATPSIGEPDHADRGRRTNGNIPKLARTMTDIYGDELYSPNFAITSSSPAQSHNPVSPSSQIFSQRINAANHQHLNAVQSPSSSAGRAVSPFRACSPFAPPQAQDFNVNHNAGFKSRRTMHEQNNGQQGPQMHDGNGAPKAEPDTPKTISPKDAVLEFNDPDGEQNFSLFPQGSGSFDFDAFSKSIGNEADQMGTHMGVPHDNASASSQALFPSPMPLENRIPQQYPFVSRTHTAQEMTPPRLSSASSSSVESNNSGDAMRSRPSKPGAQSGTYTCTYHGCTLRFDTPVQLQKHKREGHRQTQNLPAPRIPDASLASGLLNSQAGPHRCDRINPSTGKPCGTVFSRPYDLTRHEDTIHNERKLKVRCDLCTVEKSFSRADALTRHYRVCHPEAELPGKLRRRT